jgi:type IX secretion system PorP/SprF family membrane protein
MKWKIFYILLLFNQINVFAQQDAQFGQYVFNNMHINPAYTGYKEELYLQAFSRAQWTGIRGAPQTLSIAADEALYYQEIGLGLVVNKDRIGAQNSLSATGNFSYRIKLDKSETNVLAFGIGIGATQMGIDGSLLDPAELGDNRIPVGSESKIVPQFRTGVFYSNLKYFIGLSATNLLGEPFSLSSNNQQVSIKQQPHLYLTAGMALPLNDNLIFKPTFLLKDDIKGPTSLDLNAFFLFNERIWIGSVYRTAVKLYNKGNLQASLPKSSAIGFITEYFVRKNFRLGYGYDFSLNKLKRYDYGSHEISIGYSFITAKSSRPICFF